MGKAWQAMSLKGWLVTGVLLAVLPGTSFAEQAAAGTSLSTADMVKQATQQSVARHHIELLADGRAKVPSPLQAIEALASPGGITVVSTSKSEPGEFSLRAAALGRVGKPFEPLSPGAVGVSGELARIAHPGLVEELTTSAQGIRQDFVVPAAPQGSGELALDLEFSGATLERAGEAVTVTLPQGRKLLYHQLHVTDSADKTLAARFELPDANRLRIIVADAGAAYPVRIDPTLTDTDWISLALPDTNGPVKALVWDGTNLYAGGIFTVIGGVATNRIAKWDGSAWSALGSGMNSDVYALAWDGANLYAGGYFTTAGGKSANRIAKWDGNTWSDLGSGTNGSVNALVWDGTSLYAGGQFGIAGGTSANFIAKWDGSAWSALGSGTNGPVKALAFVGTNLYAGGGFTTAGGTGANFIAKWDGSAWSALGDGVELDVLALASDGTNLYAGGYFTTAGGTNVNHIAKWDGSTWSALGEGMDRNVYALAWGGTNLYAGGDFATAGGTDANLIAKWDGNAWSPLGSGMSKNVVQALASDGTNLYAGGWFDTAGETNANFIAKWDGGAWSSLGLSGGMNGRVYALTFDGTNLYAGGSFTVIGGVAANRIAKWDGSTWSPLGSGYDWVFGEVYALAWDGTNLYAGGFFFFAKGALDANNIAKWDGSAWSPLGSGVSGQVETLAFDGTNLYAGGNFTTAGGVSANNIAKWDGSAWMALGSGINGWVNDLTSDGTNLYAGGYFTTAGGVSANNIAKWDGSAWLSLGSGMNEYVATLVFDGTNLYAGGNFTTAGGVSANYIARWNGSAWSALGSGVNSSVYALTLDGTYLYAGGYFTTAGETSANYVARWDGSTWSALGSGMGNYVWALTFDGTNLYAGGLFATAGGAPAAVASFEALHKVTTTAMANGSISPASATIAHNETREFTITPESGYRIDTVSGCDGSLSDNTYTTGPVKAACEVTATFARITHDLTVTIDGSGKVEDDQEPQFTCTSGSCGQGYGEGTTVKLTATPDPGFAFTGWTGACTGTGDCQMTMDAAKNVTATFGVSGTPCAPPQTFSVPPSNQTGSFTISWLKSPLAGVSYVLEEDDGTGWREIYTGTSLYVKLTRPDGDYLYRVKAIRDGYTDSLWLEKGPLTVTLTCLDPPSLSVPAGSTSGALTVSWQKSGTPGVSYVLSEDDGNGWQEIYSGTGTYVKLTRSNGTYRYKVQATLDNYQPSNEVVGVRSAVVVLTCLTPSTISVPASNATGSYTVSWQKSGTPGVVYQVEESSDGGTNWAAIGTDLALNYMKVTGKLAGSYRYRVQATRDSYVPSEWKTGGPCTVEP